MVLCDTHVGSGGGGGRTTEVQDRDRDRTILPRLGRFECIEFQGGVVGILLMGIATAGIFFCSPRGSLGMVGFTTTNLPRSGISMYLCTSVDTARKQELNADKGTG